MFCAIKLMLDRTALTNCTHSYFKTPVFILLQKEFFFPSFLSFVSSFTIFHTFIIHHDVTQLQYVYKGYMQSNKQMAFSRLNHSMYYDNA